MILHRMTLHQTQPVITESRIFGYDEDDEPWHKVLDIFQEQPGPFRFSPRALNVEG